MHVLQLYIEGLCHGNLLEEEAISISHIFKTNFSVPPLPIEMRHQEQIIDLPSGANLVRDVGVKNKLEKNSVVEVTETGYFGITSMFPSSLISFIGLLWQLCSFFFFFVLPLLDWFCIAALFSNRAGDWDGIDQIEGFVRPFWWNCGGTTLQSAEVIAGWK